MDSPLCVRMARHGERKSFPNISKDGAWNLSDMKTEDDDESKKDEENINEDEDTDKDKDPRQDTTKDKLLTISLPRLSEQSQLIANNPAITSMIFNRIVEAFTKVLLGMNLDDTIKSTKMGHSGGIFRRIFAFYGVTEAQGRGTEHMHGINVSNGVITHRQ